MALLPNMLHEADWQAVEHVQAYAVAGKTGAELYASIGERGPKGWKCRPRHGLYQLQADLDAEIRAAGQCLCPDGCPAKLIITYVLPKPAERLPPPIAKSWDVFISGVHQHELVHGELIKDMVKKIEAVSVGLTVADDPKCQKIRTELTARLGQLSRAQRQQSRDFDQAELNSGGNIHQLVLALINGQ
jgi:predicted secreted Zn-dependent protease